MSAQIITTNGSNSHINPTVIGVTGEITSLLNALKACPADALQDWAIDQAPLLSNLTTAELAKVKLALKRAGVTKTFIDGDLADVLKAERTRNRAVGEERKGKGESPQPYQVLDGRICARQRVGEDWDYLPLCNFDARITADIEMDDGEEITRHVALVGQLATGRPLPEIVIPAKEFDSLAWVADKWGSRPVLEPGRNTKDRLRHAVSTLSAEAAIDKQIFIHTGWRVRNGKRIFLHGAGALGADNIAVEMPGRLADYIFPADDAISQREAMSACLKLLDIAPLSITGPIWSAMFLAPLSEIITPAFTLWVEGPSGSRKSTITGLMLNMFGKAFHDKHMPADWISTANQLEMLTFYAKDVPLVIDDFRPGESRHESRDLADKAARIMRAVGNRQGRGRMTKERGNARVYIPRGVVIATAELGAMGRSVVARQLTVEVRKGQIDLSLLTAAQAKRGYYGYAMKAFITYVGEHWERVANRLRRRMLRLRRFGNSDQHGRLPEATHALYSAFVLALDWASEIGAISRGEARNQRTAFYRALIGIAQQQQQKVESEDPANQFISSLVALLLSRKVLIEGKKRPDLGGESRIGWWNGTEINLLPDAAYNAVSVHISRGGGHFAATPVDLGRDLNEAGWLAAVEEDRVRVTRSDGSRKQSVYSLSAAKLLNYLQGLGLSIDDLAVRNTPSDANMPACDPYLPPVR